VAAPGWLTHGEGVLVSDCLHCEIHDMLESRLNENGADLSEIAAKVTEVLADLITQLPKSTVYAFRPTAVSATSAPVERQAAGTGTIATATRDAKRFVGGQSSVTHAGWIVQIGAF
jgi:cell division septation protein DedD